MMKCASECARSVGDEKSLRRKHRRTCSWSRHGATGIDSSVHACMAMTMLCVQLLQCGCCLQLFNCAAGMHSFASWLQNKSTLVQRTCHPPWQGSSAAIAAHSMLSHTRLDWHGPCRMLESALWCPECTRAGASSPCSMAGSVALPPTHGRGLQQCCYLSCRCSHNVACLQPSDGIPTTTARCNHIQWG